MHWKQPPQKKHSHIHTHNVSCSVSLINFFFNINTYINIYKDIYIFSFKCLSEMLLLLYQLIWNLFSFSNKTKPI